MTGYEATIADCQCCRYKTLSLHKELAKKRANDHARRGHKVTIEVI